MNVTINVERCRHCAQNPAHSRCCYVISVLDWPPQQQRPLIPVIMSWTLVFAFFSAGITSWAQEKLQDFVTELFLEEFQALGA